MEGRLIVIGFQTIPSPSGHLLVKNYSAIGLYWGAMTAVSMTLCFLLTLTSWKSFNRGPTSQGGAKMCSMQWTLLKAELVTGRLVVAP